MKRRTQARMYHRPDRGWYGDFRNYAEVGGGREALAAEGSGRATDDQAAAAGSYNSALWLHWPPTIRTFPSGRSVAV